jgi:predicted nucleic acid-binding protein
LKSKRKEKNKYTLDTYAVLTYLKEEPGWQKVRNLLWDAFKEKHELYLSAVNYGEIYYIIHRENEAALADQIMSYLRLWPIKLVAVDEDLALIAGRVKAENKISYADAYAVATALHKRTAIVTGDREFKSVQGQVKISWLPRNR